MKKSVLAAVCTLALVPLTGLPASAQTDPAQVGVSTAPPWSQTGKDFVQHMMMGNKFELEASRLALSKSRDPAIRDFARDMIAAHTEMGEDLKAASDSTLVGQTVTPPPVLDPQHQEMYAALDGSFGRNFDRIFINEQFDVHHDALATLEGYARHGGVWQLQRFASHTIPVVRDHLAMLRNLRGDAVARIVTPDDTVAMNLAPEPSDTTIIHEPDGSTTTVIDTE